MKPDYQEGRLAKDRPKTKNNIIVHKGCLIDELLKLLKALLPYSIPFTMLGKLGDAKTNHEGMQHSCTSTTNDPPKKRDI